MEEFKLHVIKQLHKIGARQQKAADEDTESGFIFIDAAPEDMHLTGELVRCLKKYHFRNVAWPMPDAQNASDAMNDLKDEADVVVLLYHAASQAWVRQHLRQCLKAQRGRNNNLIAICQDQPENKKEIGMMLPNLKIFHCPDFQTESYLAALIGGIKGKI